MGYIRAEEILPVEIIELIQQYVDGTTYIFREGRKTGRSGEAKPHTDGNCKTGINGFTETICQAGLPASWQKAIIYQKRAYSGLSDRKNFQMWADFKSAHIFL